MTNFIANCRDIEVLLDAFYDGCLSDPEMQAVRKHLSHCPACQNQLNEIEHLVKMLKSMPVLEPMSNLSEGFNRLQPTQRNKLELFAWLPLGLASAAAFVLAICLAGTWQDKLTTSSKQICSQSKGQFIENAVSDDLLSAYALEINLAADSAQESIGIPTNEDGLYAIEM